ncbi:MAG: ribosome maturation factor RimM [Saprospiraceae bacterium]
METLIEVGSIRKTHGYGGEVKLVVVEGYGIDIKKAEFLFIGRVPEKAIPYELDRLRGADWIAKLVGLDSKEEAADLRGQSLYLREDEVTQEIIVEKKAAEEVSQKFAGYALIDEQLGEIAVIEEVVSYPQQELAKLTYNGQEVLVPLNPALITGVDFTKKIVFTNLPEGLLDL